MDRQETIDALRDLAGKGLSRRQAAKRLDIRLNQVSGLAFREKIPFHAPVSQNYPAVTWGTDNIAELGRMVEAGMKNKTIARIFGTSLTAINSVRGRCGMSKPRPAGGGGAGE